MNIYTIFFEGEKLNILELFIRASILYFMLFGSTKTMGFRQSGRLTPYNFLMASGISHIAASRMVNPKSRLVDAMVIIVIYTLVNLFISYLYFKAPSAVSQKPVILVKNGKVIKDNLLKAKLTIDNLFSILRQKDAPNLEKVEYLIAEATGDFSAAINSNNLPITKLDMAIESKQDILSQILIYKGNVDEKILKMNSLSYDWIETELKSNNIDTINDIYLGILTSDKKLYVSS
ncbi:YetF domain-containing protein [Clostridium peptidivorans]|uniref:YetF domain-containing protein n=1 Tax=Clostridium peptidivorans TaxID=100174 RepID=UPI000BE36EBB|nr:YetF domain-containing protein [Clostridium peptidivorans]